MRDDIRTIYTGSLSFARALPLLFLVPAVPEFLQHVVEIKLGMYASAAAAHAMALDASRLEWGYVKTLALLLPGYWLTRYLAFDRDARRAGKPEWPAIGLWLALFLVQGGLQGWQLFGPSLATLAGLTGRPATIATAVLTLATSAAGIYLTAWMVAWPLGNARCGPLTSIRVMTGSFWRTILYLVAGILPLIIVHYALGLGAIGRPAWLFWPMLVVDSLVVALLAHTMSASSYVAARHAARRRGVSLTTVGG